MEVRRRGGGKRVDIWVNDGVVVVVVVVVCMERV